MNAISGAFGERPCPLRPLTCPPCAWVCDHPGSLQEVLLLCKRYRKHATCQPICTGMELLHADLSGDCVILHRPPDTKTINANICSSLAVSPLSGTSCASSSSSSSPELGSRSKVMTVAMFSSLKDTDLLGAWEQQRKKEKQPQHNMEFVEQQFQSLTTLRCRPKSWLFYLCISCGVRRRVENHIRLELSHKQDSTSCHIYLLHMQNSQVSQDRRDTLFSQEGM